MASASAIAVAASAAVKMHRKKYHISKTTAEAKEEGRFPNSTTFIFLPNGRTIGVAEIGASGAETI